MTGEHCDAGGGQPGSKAWCGRQACWTRTTDRDVYWRHLCDRHVGMLWRLGFTFRQADDPAHMHDVDEIERMSRAHSS